MSLVDVCMFTEQVGLKSGEMGPVLLAVFESMLRQIVVLCDQNKFDITQIPAFRKDATDWHWQLLQIYKNTYKADCHKHSKKSSLRGLPETTLAYSKSLKSFIDFLHARGCPNINQKLQDIREQVHTEVYGSHSQTGKKASPKRARAQSIFATINQPKKSAFRTPSLSIAPILEKPHEQLQMQTSTSFFVNQTPISMTHMKNTFNYDSGTIVTKRESSRAVSEMMQTVLPQVKVKEFTPKEVPQHKASDLNLPKINIQSSQKSTRPKISDELLQRGSSFYRSGADSKMESKFNSRNNSVAELKPLPVIQVPDYLTPFDQDRDIQFGTVGLFNLSMQETKSLYRVYATVNGQKFMFNKVDWPTITKTIWRFNSPDATFKTTSTEHSCIIYNIQKQDLNSKSREEFGFAVQPVFLTLESQAFLVQGQFQLPVFQGQCPPELTQCRDNPMKLIKDLLSKKTIQSIDFVQLISRVGYKDCQENYIQQWYPEVEPRMLFLVIQDKTHLPKYMLHAKHKAIDQKVDKLPWLQKEDTNQLVTDAKGFII